MANLQAPPNTSKSRRPKNKNPSVRTTISLPPKLLKFVKQEARKLSDETGLPVHVSRYLACLVSEERKRQKAAAKIPAL